MGIIEGKVRTFRHLLVNFLRIQILRSTSGNRGLVLHRLRQMAGKSLQLD